MKKWITFGLIVGSTIGGFIPMLWGGSAFSGWAIITSTIGGIFGIWGGYKLSQYFDF